MLHAAHVSPAGELTKAGLAAAEDVERGIKLRATPDGIVYQNMIEEWAKSGTLDKSRKRTAPNPLIRRHDALVRFVTL
jgi:hypothetical protein